MSWTDARVDQLKALVAEGHSAAEIAAWIGIGRNAVIGKVSRLGLRLLGRSRYSAAPTVSDDAVLVGKREGRKHDPGIAKTPPEPPKPPDCVPVSLLAAGFGQCRFPVAEWSGPDAPFYCGAPVEREGASYCRWHARIARGAGTPSERRAHRSEGRAVA